ncbi:MAG: DUF1553 domain-containing protein, partial [Planctomycetaceae bacterium]|nr:DUF1553 domain-containing protein [Planctomycetaceae bacterium]
LTPVQVDLLKQWVAAGAPWGDHWAYVAPERPALPAVSDPGWGNNAIDAFILARLESVRLVPGPEAARTQQLRRVTLDLTGIPPTIQELDAFLADDSPDAYERAVDRLLATPRYGERMAWEWLDAARYSDTSGFQGDPERTMWPWRDWVIDALNADMPFDQFTVEQLAGDLLPEAARSQQVATGFCRNNMHNGEGGRIPEETRIENVFDRAETLATVWLGTTLTCARCHDHKYDPLSQREYYQLFAFFNNTTEEGGGFRGGRIPPVMALPTAEQATELNALDLTIAAVTSAVTAWERDHAESLTAQADEPSGVSGDPATASESQSAAIPDDVRSALAKGVGERSSEELKLLIDHFKTEHPTYSEQLQSLKDTRERRSRIQGQVVEMMVMDVRAEPRETFILDRGAYDKPGERVTAAIPARLPELPAGRNADRLALAEWLVDPGHPLTARVTVNREWQRFFGVGLVRTAEDFGSQGERPSHPELLDWLATEFLRTGWDVKALHRLFVTSATYRQSSRVTPELQERDPKNQLLARGPRYRMPSWMLRDQALALGGLLNETQRGPSVKPYQPAGIWDEATFGKKTYVQDHGGDLYRRSLYTYWRRIVGPTMFFDAAKRQTCEVNALRTNTPLHALTTMNDITYVEAARAMAQCVLTNGGVADESRVVHAFRSATSRHPTAEEQSILIERFHSLAEKYAADSAAAAQLLNVGESPRDASINVAEHAAMTALCLMILNLDETLTRE